MMKPLPSPTLTTSADGVVINAFPPQSYVSSKFPVIGHHARLIPPSPMPEVTVPPNRKPARLYVGQAIARLRIGTDSGVPRMCAEADDGCYHVA